MHTCVCIHIYVLSTAYCDMYIHIHICVYIYIYNDINNQYMLNTITNYIQIISINRVD